MSRLKEALETGKFGVTAEMAPPKGYDFTEQLEAGKLLAPKVHAVNVTDMQSASLKASSLGLCIALKNAGVEPILQMTGRDRNRMAIMGDILSVCGELRHRLGSRAHRRPSGRGRLQGRKACI